MTLFLVGGLTGCAPTDEHIFNFQERLDRGIPITYDKPGQMSDICRNPWSEARIDEEWMQNLVYFRSVVHTGAGELNCYEVGSEIRLVEKNGTPYNSNVKAYVDKVVIWKPKRFADDLEDEITRYLGQTLNLKSDLSNFLLKSSLDLLGSELSFSQRDERKGGVIHSTFLRYVTNTASQKFTQSVSEKVIERFEATKFEETNKDGETLSASCGTRKFSDYRTSPETWELIKSGKTSTAWDIGKLLCSEQGSEMGIALKDNEGNWTVVGKVTVGKMRRLKIDALKPEFLSLNKGITKEDVIKEIKEMYKEQTSKNPDLRLILFDFTNVVDLEGGE